MRLSVSADSSSSRARAGAGERVDIGLFREIEVGFEVGDQVEQAVAQAR